MRTSKPISTISYNSEKFLVSKLSEWRNKGIIDFAMWIRHEPDVDGDKPHFHVYLEPSKIVQTDDLVFDSHEIDPDNELPLKMTVFRNSKADDWILYGLHDEAYLIDKGLSRNIHYDKSDLGSTCPDTLADMVSRAFDYRNHKLEFRIINGLKNGMSWSDMVSSGMIPIRQISGARLFYMALTGQEKLF